MTGIVAAAASLNPAEKEEMSGLVQNINKKVESDDPKALSLVKIYEKWKARRESGESLEIAQVKLVYTYLLVIQFSLFSLPLCCNS